MAAMQQEAAKKFEKQCDWENALKAYQSATDLFKADNNLDKADECLAKVAEVLARQGHHDQAIELFEAAAANHTCGEVSYSDPPSECYMKATICALEQRDMVKAAKNLERYCNLDAKFRYTAEHSFSSQITDALDTMDADFFWDSFVEFDEWHPLDTWTSHFINKFLFEFFGQKRI